MEGCGEPGSQSAAAGCGSAGGEGACRRLGPESGGQPEGSGGLVGGRMKV